MEPRFDVFFGIDQTGAVAAGGLRARPLHCAVLIREGPKAWRLRLRDAAGSRLALPQWNPEHCGRLVSTVRGPADWRARSAFMVDCVFGLARGSSPVVRGARGLWKLFRAAAASEAYGEGGPKYGLKVATVFFEALQEELQSPEKLPRRQCELLARANSVFQTRPFQKNIQTGTFRMWRDLGEEKPWLNFWPFERFEPGGAGDLGRPWVFESFPTLFWRDLLGLRTRDRARLRRAVEAAWKARGMKLKCPDWDLAESDPDIADAAVLALGGAMLQADGRLFEPFKGFWRTRDLRLEGWIAGLCRGPMI